MSYIFDVVKAFLLDSYPYAETLIQSELETLTGVDISWTLKEQWRIEKYMWGEMCLSKNRSLETKKFFWPINPILFFPPFKLHLDFIMSILI